LKFYQRTEQNSSTSARIFEHKTEQNRSSPATI